MSRTALPTVDITVVPTATDGSTARTAYGVENGVSDYVDLYECGSGFVAFAVVTQTATGTTPTLDIRIEHSADMENWATLADFTQITTGAGTYFKSVSPPFARYVRFTTKFANADNVYTYYIRVAKLE
jgi:hypothetical protein